MKTILFALLSVAIFNTFIFSQVKPKVELGKPYPSVDNQYKKFYLNFESIVSIKNDPSATIYKKGKTFIQQYDINGLSESYRTEYSIPKDFDFVYEGPVGNKYYMIFSQYDKTKKEENLYYQEVNADVNKMGKEPTLLFKFERNTLSKLEKMITSNDDDEKFKLYISNNAQNLLFTFPVVSINNNEEFYTLILNVYSSNYKKIWNNNVKIPYPCKDIKKLRYIIGDDANVCILAELFNDASHSLYTKEGNQNYHYEVLTIDRQTGEIKKVPIDLENKILTNLRIFDVNPEYFICTGFSFPKKDFKLTDGLNIFKIGKNGTFINKTIYKIPTEIENLYSREKVLLSTKPKSEYEKMIIDNVILQKDNSILLIGEESYTDHYNNVTGYYFLDMMFVKINSDGTLAYNKRLPKIQAGRSNNMLPYNFIKGEIGSLSYKYMKGENYHYLIFADNLKNFPYKLNKVPDCYVEGKEGCIAAYKINDKDGSFEKIKLANTEDVAGNAISDFNIFNIIPVSLNSFVIEASKKKNEDILIKITLP